MASTYYLDFAGGNDANDGTTFANRWKTITSGATAARIAPGDTIRMKQSPAPTTLSTTLAWTTGNKTAVATTAVNKTVDNCDSAWTGAANVTSTAQSTNKKNGTNALSLAIASAFTTGIVAYKTLGLITDFSAYQQVCFWIRCNAAVAASTFRLDLCTDTIGAVPANSFTITDAHQNGNWLKVVMDNGSGLSALINSVSLVALLDPGTVTVNLDIVFCAKAPGNADELTLHSLISKANGSGTSIGDVQWWPIMGIDGTTIEFDGGNSINSGSQRGYYGTTGTVTTYARQPIVLSQVTTAGANLPGVVQDAGTAVSYITFSGGWDSTNMSTQPGDTFIGVNNGFGTAFNNSAKNYIAVEHLHVCGTFDGISIDGLFATVTDCGAYGCDDQGIRNTGSTCLGTSFTRCVGMCNTLQGFNTNQNLAGGHLYVSCSAFSNGTIGYTVSTPLCRYQSCVAYNNSTVGWSIGANNSDFDTLLSCLTGGNGTSAIAVGPAGAGGRIRARKCTFGEATVYSITGVASPDGYVQSQHNGNVTGTHVTYGNGVTISSDTSTVHTAGTAAKIALSSLIRTSLFPVKLKLADLSLVANQLVTISVWVRRDTSTSTAQLIWPGNQIAGVDADVTSSASASINTWEQLTITFTPTAADVGAVFLYCSYTAGTPNIWVDDLALAQPQP